MYWVYTVLAMATAKQVGLFTEVTTHVPYRLCILSDVLTA